MEPQDTVYVVVPRDVDPEAMLHGWRSTHEKEAQVEAILLDDWPEAGLIMRQLGRFVTAEFPHPSGEPLLYVCFSSALNAYEEARMRGASSPKRLLKFAKSLLAMAAMLCDYRVTAWGHTWHPEQGEPLLDWLAIRGRALTIRRSREAGVRPAWRSVGQWVLDERLITLIDRAEQCSRQ